MPQEVQTKQWVLYVPTVGSASSTMRANTNNRSRWDFKVHSWPRHRQPTNTPQGPLRRYDWFCQQLISCWFCPRKWQVYSTCSHFWKVYFPKYCTHIGANTSTSAQCLRFMLLYIFTSLHFTGNNVLFTPLHLSDNCSFSTQHMTN